MQRSHRRPALNVTTGGKGVVGHAGARLLCDLADELGLTEGLSAAIADGATTITDLRVLANQPSLFGEVASTATAWRTLESVDDAALAGIARARAEARKTAWQAGLDPGFYVIDIDGTLINSHSDKEGAAANYKHGFGFYPLMAYLDATGEPLAGLLRPGNAGSGTAADHVTVLDAALFQLPIDPHDTEVIVRADSAGCSHDFLNVCPGRGVRFVVGHNLTADIAACS